MRNKVNNLERHAKEKFYSNLETNLMESSSNNKRDFWKIIRHFVKSNASSTPKSMNGTRGLDDPQY